MTPRPPSGWNAAVGGLGATSFRIIAVSTEQAEAVSAHSEGRHASSKTNPPGSLARLTRCGTLRGIARSPSTTLTETAEMQVIARSWSLFRSALTVLGAEKAFVLYPLLAGLGILIFSALILGGGTWLLTSHPELAQALSQLDQQAQDDTAPWWAYAGGALLLWLFLLATSFIANFFLTALVGGALERLRGGDPSFGDGLALARERASAIFGYSLIAATVGLLLSLLRGRQQQPGAGALLANLGGFAWSVATFLVVPVLAAKDLGPFAAIRESAILLKRTWGEQLSIAVGLGLIIGLPMLLLFAGTAGAAAWAASADLPMLAVSTLVVGVTLMALLILVSATINAIVRGAVYVYAETGEVPRQFDDELIRHALRPRK